MSKIGKTSKQKVREAKATRKRARLKVAESASLERVASKKEQQREAADSKPQEEKQEREGKRNGERQMHTIFEFLFDSAFQVVTWVFIAAALGGFWVFYSMGNARGMLWSICGLFCSVAIMLCLLAQRHFPIFAAKSAIPPTSTSQPVLHPTPERPAFRISADPITLSWGGNAARYKLSELEKGVKVTWSYGDYSPVLLYAQEGKIYADIEMYDRRSQKAVEVRRNLIGPLHPGWDFNSNPNALEIVDENQSPVLQLIYEDSARITVKGVFPTPDGAYIDYVGKGVTTLPSKAPPPPDFSLKAIFKYPSWKYPSQYAEPQTTKERAQVFFNFIRLKEPLTSGKKPVVEFQFFNSGTKEAKGAVTDVSWSTTGVPFTGLLEYQSGSPRTEFTLAPTAVQFGAFDSGFIPSKAKIADLDTGRMLLFIYARANYTDESGETYTLPFCFCYNKNVPGKLIFCPSDTRIKQD